MRGLESLVIALEHKIAPGTTLGLVKHLRNGAHTSAIKRVSMSLEMLLGWLQSTYGLQGGRIAAIPTLV